MRRGRKSVDELIARLALTPKKSKVEEHAPEKPFDFEEDGVDMGQISVVRETFDCNAEWDETYESVWLLGWDVWWWWKDRCGNLIDGLVNHKTKLRKCESGNGAISFHVVVYIRFKEHVCHTWLTNVNHLTFTSDQHLISPNNITLESNIKVMRIEEMIIN